MDSVIEKLTKNTTLVKVPKKSESEMTQEELEKKEKALRAENKLISERIQKLEAKTTDDPKFDELKKDEKMLKEANQLAKKLVNQVRANHYPDLEAAIKNVPTGIEFEKFIEKESAKRSCGSLKYVTSNYTVAQQNQLLEKELELELGKKIWNRYTKISRESINLLTKTPKEAKKKNQYYISLQAKGYIKCKDDQMILGFKDDIECQGYFLICATWMR